MAPSGEYWTGIFDPPRRLVETGQGARIAWQFLSGETGELSVSYADGRVIS